LKELLISREKLLILVNWVVYALFINITLCKILCGFLIDLAVIEFENMKVSLFEFIFHLKIDDF
tara:strand:- start:379 stop:570 length:192 start_codon:yes stop_codon:yes gene_type:complete